MRRAFTLVELLAVLSILAIAASLAVFSPSILRSSEQDKSLSILRFSLIKAQINSRTYATTCGIRVERAMELNEFGQIKKNNVSNPIYKNYQKITQIVFGHKQSDPQLIACLEKTSMPIIEPLLYCKIKEEEIVYLSDNFWIKDPNVDTSFNKSWQPNSEVSVPFNLFETMYILFDYRGELAKRKEKIYYADETQRYQLNGEIVCPAIEKPSFSSLSFFLYDRKKFEATNTIEGREIFISRGGQALK